VATKFLPATLTGYLKLPGASHAREELLMHRLLFDLKLAAARRGYHLLTYRSDVDVDGFDCILDDRDTLRKFQVKSVIGGTGTWEIHRKLLRPDMYSAEMFGFEPTHVGQEGGVILIKASEMPNRDLAIGYRYTDLHILTAIDSGLIKCRADTKAAVDRAMKSLRNPDEAPDRIEISSGAFVTAKSVDALLALAGIHSTCDHQWRFNLPQVIAADFGRTKESEESIEARRRLITEELGKLIV
jgi:hypothetical protein